MSQPTTAPDGGLDPDQEALYSTLCDFIREIDTPFNTLFETLGFAREEGRIGPELRRRLRRELRLLVDDLKLLARIL